MRAILGFWVTTWPIDRVAVRGHRVPGGRQGRSRSRVLTCTLRNHRRATQSPIRKPHPSLGLTTQLTRIPQLAANSCLSTSAPSLSRSLHSRYITSSRKSRSASHTPYTTCLISKSTLAFPALRASPHQEQYTPNPQYHPLKAIAIPYPAYLIHQYASHRLKGPF